jgi:hypothetical protein
MSEPRTSGGLSSGSDSNVNPVNRMTPEAKRIVDELRKSMGWTKGVAPVEDKAKEIKRIKTAPFPLKGGGISGPYGIKNR